MATIAPPNSFLAPQQVQQPAQSSLATYKPTQFGALQPLVSDLLTPVAPANKYLQPSYQADPTKIQERLGQYGAYDLSQLGELSDYFRTKVPAVQDNKAYFKPSEFEQAQAGLSGLTTEQYNALSPLMGEVPSIGKLNNVTYYDRPTIESALDKYKFLPKAGWDAYADVLTSRGVSPVATLSDQVVLNKSDFEKLPGQKYYQSVDVAQPTVTQTSPEPQEFQEIFAPKTEQINVGGRTYQIETPAGQGGIFRGINKYNTKLYEVSPEGALQQVFGNRTPPVSLQMATAVRDPRLKEWLAKDDPATRADDLIREIWGSDPTGALMLYGQQAARKEGGPDRTPDTFAFTDQAYWPAVYGGMQWDLSPEISKAVNALKLNSPQAQQASEAWRSAMSPSAQSARNDPGGGGLLGSLNSFMNKVDPLNGAIENAVGKALGFDSGLDMVRGIGEPVGNLAGAIFSGGIPWGSIVMAADNISTGNDKALMGNLISGVGSYAGANMPTGSVAGTGYSLGSNAANAAANQALISAASTAVRGGNFSDILKNAAISGLGSYGGGVMSGATKNLSPLAKMAAQTAYGTGVGGLSSALRGKGFSQGASNAARRGITNAAINAALNSQLYKGLV